MFNILNTEFKYKSKIYILPEIPIRKGSIPKVGY